MIDQIRVLIVDDVPATRDHLTRLLGLEPDMTVVGAASSGRQAIDMATELRPDVVLMDINMPQMDGIAAAEVLSAQVPTPAVVMMSIQGETDYLRRSMLAGAREFLVKPFSSDELSTSIRQVHSRERAETARLAVPARGDVTPPKNGARGKPGRVVAVFSPKGGVGRTTMAVNVAIAAATDLHRKVVLVDGSFQFGDVGALLNLDATDRSIAKLALELGAGEPESLDTFLVTHPSGLRVLLAPPSPEMAELVTAGAVQRVLEALRADHDLVIVDCAADINDTTLAVLDAADSILTILTPEITSIKDARLFLQIAEQLTYDAGKVKLVVNRADGGLGIRVSDIENAIGRKTDHTVVADGRSVASALNRGVPFYISNREARVSEDVLGVARAVAGDQASVAFATEARTPGPRRSLLAWR